jgi:hypothetical protein
MNRDSLWIVVAVAAVWVSFLLGYAVSSHTGATLAGGPKAAAGGYGKVPAKAAGQPEAKKGQN